MELPLKSPIRRDGKEKRKRNAQSKEQDDIYPLPKQGVEFSGNIYKWGPVGKEENETERKLVYQKKE